MLNPPPPSRASPAPTGVSVVHKSPITPQIFVGAELARESGGSVTISGTDPPLSRASSAPTWGSVVPKIPNTPQIPVGASLLAIALGQSPSPAQTPRFREQAHSYRVLGRTQIPYHPIILCSCFACWLKRWVSHHLRYRSTAFASKLSSYRFLGRTQIPKHPTNPCGSELAREGGGSGNIFCTDIPLSRAGSLLQGFAPYTNLRTPHKSL
jgi:hypothetical protein